MKDENFITITGSDISLLQEALRNYYQTKEIKTESFMDSVYSTLRKLYSIQVSLNKSPNKELYIQNL